MSETRSPEETARFRQTIAELVLVLKSVPADIRQAYLDELRLRTEISEPLLTLEILIVFTLLGLDHGERVLRLAEVVTQGKDT